MENILLPSTMDALLELPQSLTLERGQTVIGYDFTGKELNNARLDQTQFVSCIFDKAEIVESSLDTCTFDSCTFKGTMANDSLFDNSYFENCDFSGACMTDSYFRYCIFQTFLANGSNFSGANFHKARMTWGRFYTGGQFSQFEGAILTDMRIDAVDFRGAFLTNCDFSYSEIANSTMHSADASGSGWDAVKLINTQMTSMDLNGSAWHTTNLSCANLQSTSMVRANFFKCDFQRANLNHARVTEAQFEECNLDCTTVEKSVGWSSANWASCITPVHDMKAQIKEAAADEVNNRERS